MGNKIRVSGIDIAWHPEQGSCTFENLPVAMMWVDTTLAGLMSGVQAMVGTERFLLALQSEGRRSVEADWQVISNFSDFRKGFKAIATIAAVAGWGRWELLSLDEDQKECQFRVMDNWEGRYQKALGVCWGSGMLAGKLAGYCSKLFGTNCWANQTAFVAKGDACDEFVVKPSLRPIEMEIESLLETDEATRADMAVALRKLEREVAERKQVEEALRESEARFRLLAENASDIIFTMDKNLSFQYISPSVKRLRGFTVDEAMSQSAAEALTPASLDIAMRVFAEELEIEARETKDLWRTRTIELEETCKDGSTIWTESTFSPLRDQENNFIGFLGITRDISYRKRAEEALRASELFLKESQRIARLGGWKANPHTDYLEWTEGVYDIFEAPRDYKPSLSEGMKFFLPEYITLIIERVAQCLATGEVFTVECQAITTTGKRFWAEIRGLAPIIEGARSYVIGTLQDIDERKRAEKERQDLESQLEQIRKLESVGQLAGGVAHDMNNMLTPVLGYSELLRDHLGEDNPLQKSVDEIIHAAQRARDLVLQLLAFARKQTIEMKPLNLNRVITGFEKMLRRTLRENVVIELRPAPSLGIILGDAGQIEQVLLNLLFNAQDAMPDGGALLIETAMVELDWEYVRTHEGVAPGPYVMMAVSDSGSGMDAETIQKIFDPFFTTKEQGKGTGLGLATVYGIIKQHGGHIDVQSEPGKGSTFRVYFPLKDHPHETDTVSVDSTPARGAETVLVVEDQKQVLDIACGILTRWGYNVIGAESGEEALKLAAAHEGPIHLVLTDVIMTGMNGRELHVRLNAERPGIKALYMSGYTSDVIGHHGVLDEGVHFIQKPFSLQSLASKVRDVLDNDFSSNKSL
jgi:PAS domain S-box-containing protein